MTDEQMRDWFAGQALNGAIAILIEAAKQGSLKFDVGEKEIAMQAYEIAEAMLKQRKARR